MPQTIEDPPTATQLQSAIEVLRRAPARQVQQLGYHFQKNNYYSPLNDLAFLEANEDLWTEAVMPADIDWHLDHQVEVAAEVGSFVPELTDVPETAQDAGPDDDFYWRNGMWNNADALVQYGLVRSRQPRRYVEIGCGWSSLLLARALGRNETPCAVTLVEPYPNHAVLSKVPDSWEVIESPLQRAPLELFDRLGEGDVLFYDGSHCSKVASDVNWFFFRVLPRVRPGVLIHVHDIFFPHEYPRPWIFERGQTWNEQYILQALLMNSTAYQVEIVNRMLAEVRRSEVEQLYRGVRPVSGCSLWMTKTAEPVVE